VSYTTTLFDIVSMAFHMLENKEENIMIFRRVVWLMIFLVAIFTLQACGGGSSTSSSSSSSSSSGGASMGAINLSLVDSPGDYDHVWITVKDVWFHTSTAAGPNDPAWLKYPLPTPVTVDLIALGNGNISQAFWSGIQLPVGIYQQIRLFLVPTYAANPPAGHSNFNEVVIGSKTYPLRIADADHGIRLIGTFQVANGATLKLAIDFDAGDDVVDYNGAEYILKPRLAYFDLDNVGAIVGQISTGTTFTTSPHFVIKAEKLSADGSYHVVHRITVPDSTGKFILYPVSAATATTTYDVLIRGIGYQTAIVKGVPVTKGTTPTLNPTSLPTITLTPDTDFAVSATIASPTGAWVNFYQTLPMAGEVPYDVRFRHFHPITGTFNQFMLSKGQLNWGVYSSNTITLNAVDPAEGLEGYQVVAGADGELYDRSAFSGSVNPTITSVPATHSVILGALTVTSPWQGNTVTGRISMSNPTTMNNNMDTGVVFAVHGGLIVNAISTMRNDMPFSDVYTGGTYTISNIPGGTTQNPLPSAFYGIDAALWSSTTSTYKAIAIPQVVDLRSGNDTADLQMLPLW